MRLIVTRPADDLAPLKAKLEATGHEVLAAPLLAIAFTGADVARKPYQAVLVTSANGARAIARHPERARIVTSDAIAVGPASAAAAREAGFARVEEAAGGDVDSVIAHVIATRNPDAGPLLYASGEVTAGKLEEELGARGFSVDRAILYAAQPVDALPGEALAAVRSGTAQGVLLYSPRTASVWAALVAAANLTGDVGRLHHLCISANTAAAIRSALPHVPVSVASVPTEQGMLALVAGASA
jgi:uroporphyrinogen-III synthase